MEQAACGSLPFAQLPISKMPAHWLMARLGKRVLRPGGIETTRWLLDEIGIGPKDDVVELAAGLGLTARLILAAQPRSYTGVDREPEAIAQTANVLAKSGRNGSVIRANASKTPLPDGCASVVIGEAMLSMSSEATKLAIASEVRRLLRPGGAYGIHELATDPDKQDEVERDFSDAIHVGVRIRSVPHWNAWLDRAGFETVRVRTTPMHLLEPARLLHDEGLWGAASFMLNAARVPGAARRLRGVREVFRKHEKHVCAVAIVAQRA